MALDPITAGIDLIGTVVNKLFPDKSEQERAQLAAAMSIIQGQLDINKAEAGSMSVFTSGWRPFIGWVCGLGCAWNWIGLPVGKFIMALAGFGAIQLFQADLGEMMPLLMGMLGLGALRTVEKIKGVSS
jgi:hypothetical protein